MIRRTPKNMAKTTFPHAPKPRIRALAVLPMALVLLGASGCAPSLIPNTDVEDTSPNKKVIGYCEQYRHSVEEKNVGLLLKMASERYYEDGGNTNAEDDIDFSGLKEYLAGSFVKTNAIRYEIRYRRVTFTQNEKVYVDYTYSASYKLPGLKGEEWRHTVADNRLVLIPDGDSYKILSGM
jgi:hypothetical protein